jgi:hypothetical protein
MPGVGNREWGIGEARQRQPAAPTIPDDRQEVPLRDSRFPIPGIKAASACSK